MPVVNKKIRLSTNGDTDIIDITGDIEEALRGSGLKNGILSVFVSGSTGGITTVEYEPGLIHDLKVFFEKIAPKNARYKHNERWHDGNGYAHIRSSFLGPGITIPFNNARLELGTWQQVIFIDFDNRPRTRSLTVQIIGD